MAPLILHNVPDEECYIGDDGIKRPYAMYFNQYASLANRLMTPEAIANCSCSDKMATLAAPAHGAM